MDFDLPPAHSEDKHQCPLYPQKRTLLERVEMSALCQKRTLCSAVGRPAEKTQIPRGEQDECKTSKPSARSVAISGRPFCKIVPERLFPFFSCLCHALEKVRRAFYWRRLTGTINFPPPRLLRIPSPLHDERIVSWVKLLTHLLLDGNAHLKFQTRP
jgi:hypothetical protein